MPVYSKYTEEQMRGIGHRIKFARRARGLNQGQLCERARIPSTKIVSNFELGLDVPKGNRLKLIADALGVSEEYIIDGKKEEDAMAMSTKQTRQVKIEAVEPVKPITEVPVQDTADIAKEDMPADMSAEEVKAAPAKTQKAKTSVSKTKKAKTSKSKTNKAKAKAKASEITARRKSGYVWPNSDRLVELRRQGELSITEIADFCGVTWQSVKNWEVQKYKISMHDAAKLAGLYGVSVDEIALLKEEQKAQLAAAPAAEPVRRKENTAAALPKKQEPAGPLELPENPEEMFCRNVKYFLAKKGCSDKEFENFVGCEPSFFDDAQKDGWNWKLPLAVVLKTAEFLGKTVEELVCDRKAAEIEAMAAEYERKAREVADEYNRKARELRKIIGA